MNEDPTAEKKHCISIIRINWFMLFTEIITVYSENYTKPIDAI
jgi:hypothetical protein